MSPDASAERRPATRVITGGRDAGQRGLAPALYPSTVYENDSFDDAHRRATMMRAEEFYGRYGNPTVRAFEQSIAELEGADDAMAFGSGMGAISSTVLALVSSGQHIVATRQLYAGTLAFLQGPCQRFGIDVTVVDGTEPGALAAAVEPGRTMMVIAESPSNPVLGLVDLDELGSIIGPFTMLDSTFATPLGQRPLDRGIDIVVHSATKGIAGHNDATVGVIAAEQELVDAVWAYGVLHGAMASPADCLNAHRGLRTLDVRLTRQSATAARLAEWLAERPGSFGTVHYPGLASHPQHELATRQLATFGSMLAFDLPGGEPAARKFIDGTSLIRRATSLGGPETLACHCATTTHASLTPGDQAACGVTPGLIRVSVGLEHVDDLIDELDRLSGQL